MFLEILASAIFISILSLIGVFSFYLKYKTIKKYLWILIALASGTLLSTAFFHLIPEAFENMEAGVVQFILLGILLSYVIEAGLHWHHCHQGRCAEERKIGIKPYAHLNLIGDGLHNFIDGIILAAAYMTSFHLGVLTTLAIISHEVPQEISDFGVLLHSGLHRKKALMLNFIAASTIIFGATLTFFFAGSLQIIPQLIGLAAGGFIYLSLSDLVPELHKETSTRRIIAQLIIILIGIMLMYFVAGVIPHGH